LIDERNETNLRVSLGEVIMTKYMFHINGEYTMVEADTEEEAIKEAGIEEVDAYGCNTCL
jgi:hypothetical protein